MINADRFYRDAEIASCFGERWTHVSYKEFLEFFASKEEFTAHDLVIGAYFTYGWMPTMLELRGDINEVTAIANKSRRERISKSEFSQLAEAINGSVVGASKLLHFINPRDYAIWDSRVYRYLHQEAPHQYRLVAPNAYWEYLAFLNVLAEDSRFTPFRIKVVSAIGYPVTDKRVCELLMFIKGEKENPSMSIQEDAPTSNAHQGKFTTSSPEFKNAVLMYTVSLRQSEAMEKAAREFGIHLPNSYISYPGSHINRWRSQGFPKMKP
jgi:hypothetical protein